MKNDLIPKYEISFFLHAFYLLWSFVNSYENNYYWTHNSLRNILRQFKKKKSQTYYCPRQLFLLKFLRFFIIDTFHTYVYYIHINLKLFLTVRIPI